MISGRFSSIFIVLMLSALFVSAQNTSGRFCSPLNIPLRLAGNFCEIRDDHFHSGIDIKTEGKEGLPVFAVDDGYIYRVKVSAVGYGKAIYIMHAGNVLTVYGHLSGFMSPLADSVVAMQYRNQSFESEFFPDSTFFPVKKGMQIAWSGNSGGSEAPHLHFEIRDQLTEEPLNPLLYDWHIDDTIPPLIRSISIYNYGSGMYSDADYPNLSINNNDTISIDYDSVAVAVECSDFMNDSVQSDLGIYSSLLIAGNDTVYQYRFNRMNFDQTRFVNAHIDYSKKVADQVIAHRNFSLPGNKCDIFSKSGTGWIHCKKEEITAVHLIVSDANGNHTTLHFYLKRRENTKQIKQITTLSYPNKLIAQKWNDSGVEIKEGSFYETVDYPELSRDKKSGRIAIVKVGKPGMIFHKPFQVYFNVPVKWKDLSDKINVVATTPTTKFISSVGGTLKENKIIASSRRPGYFTLALDTVSPKIKETTFSIDTVSGKLLYIIKITDNLSGVKRYQCKVDEKWFLFEYDTKQSALLTDAAKLPGSFALDIELEDGNKNVTVKHLNVVKPLE
ncbi:MAG: M23 family metallopeptidase [Bacteroidota bacterium]